MNKRLFERREQLETRAMISLGATMERASWDSCRRTGAWVGLVLFSALRKRREIATRNVQLAFPELSDAAARRIVRRSYQNFAMMFGEFLHLRAASRESVRAYCDIDRPDRIEDALSQGRGAILLTAHLGNWEVFGARYAQDFPLTAVARPTSNRGVESHIASIRAAAGIEVVSKYETGRNALRVLKSGRTLCILPDQHAGDDGALLPMFGHPTRIVTSLARIALLSGAPVMPIFGVRRTPWLADGRIISRVAPSFHIEKSGDREIDVLNGTRRVVHEIETIIRQYPEQWLWVHNRWRPRDAKDALRDDVASDGISLDANFNAR